MDDDWLFLAFVSLPYVLPLLVLAGVLVLGAALGTTIVAIVGAVRTRFTPAEPSDDVDMTEFFTDAPR
jgi:hypothetical protein